MEFNAIIPDESISLFVKSILVFEAPDEEQKTVLPFFADGYPGLIFQETTNGLWVQPQNKLMPEMFLYGQTIQPIELIMTGAYRLIVFQLYPFVLKTFFKVAPKDLNDDCYNLEQLEGNLGLNTLKKLRKAEGFEQKNKIITAFLYTLFKNKKEDLDLTIALAIQKIIDKKGQVNIADLSKEIHLIQRTFERRFFSSVGVMPKQFARIIQFQESLVQLTVNDYTKFTDIVYANGFADQSHFIKVFKAFTGKTPSTFKSRN
jgi:AraC-like DNA-binding protein